MVLDINWYYSRVLMVEENLSGCRHNMSEL